MPVLPSVWNNSCALCVAPQPNLVLSKPFSTVMTVQMLPVGTFPTLMTLVAVFPLCVCAVRAFTTRCTKPSGCDQYNFFSIKNLVFALSCKQEKKKKIVNPKSKHV